MLRAVPILRKTKGASVRRIGVSLAVALFLLGAAPPAGAACLGGALGGGSVHSDIKRGRFQIIALGRVGADIPPDAHGAVSFYLRVDHYFRGHGDPTIEVAGYGDGDGLAPGDPPGAAIEASKRFVSLRQGKRAFIFASPERGRYHGYRMAACSQSGFDDKRVDKLIAVAERMIGPLPATGPPATKTLPVGWLAVASAGASALALGARSWSARAWPAPDHRRPVHSSLHISCGDG